MKKTVQQKLTARLAQLEQVHVRHRVEGYRQTESASALLSAQRSKHDNAVRRVKAILALIGDAPDVIEGWINVNRTRCWRGGKFKVYSSQGRDICVVQPRYGVGVKALDGQDAIHYLTDEAPSGVIVRRL